MSGPVFEAVKRMTVGIAPRLLRIETDTLSRLDVPLTHRQYRILYQIDNGNSTITAVREVAATSLAAISESVEALHRRGLVRRENDANDRRVMTLSLTPDGDRALQAAEEAMAGMVDRILDELALDRDQGDSLVEILSRIDAVVTDQHRRLGESRRR